MTDNELIAAILAAGMLSPLAPPTMVDGAVAEPDPARFVSGILHAVGLYRSILEILSSPTRAANPGMVGNGEGAALRLVPTALSY